MEVIGSFSVGSEAGAEETGTAATGLVAGLAWASLELDLELGFAGGGLAVDVSELGSGDLAGGWAMVCVVVEAGVLAVILATVAKEEAGTEAMVMGGFLGRGWRSSACCGGSLGVAAVAAR